MAHLVVPDFKELLAPFIAQVPEPHLPNFLALLERGAAQRYRAWAHDMPEHTEGLLKCAQREDEIAETVNGLFPIDDEMAATIAEPLPQARDTYSSAFSNLDLHDQLALQAAAERQGAAAWRRMLDDESDPEKRARLQHCALLEEASAAYIEDMVLK